MADVDHMNVQSFLGDIPKSKFVDEYYLRRPFALDGAARPVCHWDTWEVLGDILLQHL